MQGNDGVEEALGNFYYRVSGLIVDYCFETHEKNLNLLKKLKKIQKRTYKTKKKNRNLPYPREREKDGGSVIFGKDSSEWANEIFRCGPWSVTSTVFFMTDGRTDGGKSWNQHFHDGGGGISRNERG
uniref:(northern house mosquito) hypothetical protein n=1 Tax=Culex pipiens TaxID=7175 RepID=A0A8D8LF77_CULPI